MHHGWMPVEASTWDATQRVQESLLPGEHALWIGRPSATRGLDRQDVWFVTVGIWLALVYSGVAFFGLSSSTTLPQKVLPPLIEIGYLVVLRPALRGTQRRRTVFALTPTRALVIQGWPSPGLDVTSLPPQYGLWRRTDGRGTIFFEKAPESLPSPLWRALRIVAQLILFVVGLASWPFPGTRKGTIQIIFFEIDDVDGLVNILQDLDLDEETSDTDFPFSLSERSAERIEGRLTPLRRILCAVLGVALVTSMVPIVAVRYRDYLQHSPTLSLPGTLDTALAPANYVVFEHPATLGPYDCSSQSACVTIGPSNVSVVSRSGARSVVYEDQTNEAITDGTDHYTGAVGFDIHDYGTYAITVHSSVAASFVIAKEPSEEAVALTGWISGAVAGFILIAVALVGSLMARGRRRRSR